MSVFRARYSYALRAIRRGGVVFPSAAAVGISYVNGASNYSASGSSVAADAINATAGNCIVAWMTNSDNATFTGVTDTAGNSYTQAGFWSSGGYRIECWVALNITGHASNVVTAALGSSVAYPFISVVQYSGVAASSAVDTGYTPAVATDTSTPYASGSDSTADPSELIVGLCFNGTSTTTFSNGTGTIRTNEANVWVVIDRITTAAGAYTIDVGGDNSDTHHIAAIAIKPAGGVVSHSLSVADASVSVTADTAALSQLHTIASSDAAIRPTADTAALSQEHKPPGSDASIRVTTDAAVLIQEHKPASVDAAIVVTADAATLVQEHKPAKTDAAIIVTAGSVVLTQIEIGVDVLTVADAAVRVTADAASLSQEQNLAIADAQVITTADSIVLTQIEVGVDTLVVSDAVIRIAADVAGLSQEHRVVGTDASVRVTADSVNLLQTGFDSLTVSDTKIIVTGDAVTLEVFESLNVSDAAMQATADTLVLIQEYMLSVSDVAVIPKIDNSNIYEGLPPVLVGLYVVSATPVLTVGSVTPYRELRPYK